MEQEIETGKQPNWPERLLRLYDQVEEAKAAVKRGGGTHEDQVAIANGFRAMFRMLFDRFLDVEVGATVVHVDGFKFSFAVGGLLLHQRCSDCRGEVRIYVDGPWHLAAALQGEMAGCPKCTPKMVYVPVNVQELEEIAS